ncbi:MAG: DNA methyltransferase, partial [Candidatus Odinarchaeia archaeon]
TYRLCELVLMDTIDDFELEKNHIDTLNLKSNTTFSVRVKRIKIPEKGIDPPKLEKKLGAKIRRFTSGKLKVNLNNPDHQFVGIISGNYIIFGLTVATADRKAIDKRQGKYRPRFHPGIMHPRLARAMINLTHLKKGDILLDPFVGTGGIAVEAGILGCKVIGVDIEKKMIYSALDNLRYYNIDSEVIYGDSTYPYFTKIDGCCTDPPYGTSTSTHGLELNELLSKTLSNLEIMLRKGGYFTFAIPSNINIDETLGKFKLELINSFDIYVHRSLTRRIIVLRR